MHQHVYSKVVKPSNTVGLFQPTFCCQPAEIDTHTHNMKYYFKDYRAVYSDRIL